MSAQDGDALHAAYHGMLTSWSCTRSPLTPANPGTGDTGGSGTETQIQSGTQMMPSQVDLVTAKESSTDQSATRRSTSRAVMNASARDSTESTDYNTALKKISN